MVKPRSSGGVGERATRTLAAAPAALVMPGALVALGALVVLVALGAGDVRAQVAPAARLARATAAPLEAAIVIAPAAELDAMATRLRGQRARRGDGVLIVTDIAGQGAPWIGVVAARSGALWLDTAVRSLRLTGPLARPRLAGPGYLLWVVGARRDAPDAAELEILRLGVLAPPARAPQPGGAGGRSAGPRGRSEGAAGRPAGDRRALDGASERRIVGP